VARARVFRTGESSGFTTPNPRAEYAVQNALGVGGCGLEIFILTTGSLQLDKAGSAAMLSQQVINNTADVQREE
jgi:hypothetical protein